MGRAHGDRLEETRGVTTHDRDRAFLAWLRTATTHELVRAWARARRTWQRAAILRAMSRRASSTPRDANEPTP